MERARRKETLAALHMNKEENNEETHSSRVSADTQLPSQESQGDVSRHHITVGRRSFIRA
jgi:hypothetical protein